MSKVVGAPYAGPLEISLVDVKEHLINLPKNAMQRLRTEQEGMADVVKELAQNMPMHGEAAGISPKVYQSFVDDTAAIDKLSMTEDELEEALEGVREGKAKKVHNRENTISQMSDSVRSTAHRTSNNDILGPYENMLRYNSQIAEKAAKTRRKNAESKEDPPEGQGTP